MKPLAQGYEAVVPRAFRLCINSGFANLPRSATRSTTFCRPSRSRCDRHRTAGGQLDARGGWVLRRGDPDGLERRHEDFGLTLARWGVGTGPYVVLPVLGPRRRARRDRPGADAYTNPVSYVTPVRDRYILYGVYLIDFRAELLDATR